MPLSIQEDNIELRTLLREAAATHPAPSRALQDWWAYEQSEMEHARRKEEERNAARREELTAAIAKLQAELERL